jgi:hypothetical protein
MRDYIENWLNSALIKITEIGQEVPVTKGKRILAHENTKVTSSRR